MLGSRRLMPNVPFRTTEAPNMAKRWVLAPPSPDAAAAAQRWRVSPIVAQLLINRGLAVDQPCEEFLAPKLASLHPPELLPGAAEAASLIIEAVRAKTAIVLYGDYDVDGTAGVAILWHVLKAAGANVSYYVPHRVEEGYGLNLDAARRLIDQRAGLIISVDCGITSVEVAEAVRQTGAELIITDHHAPHATIPRAAAIVHPTVGGRCPNADLCGAGVAFKVAWAIARGLAGAERVTPAFRTLLQELLSLAALGTIADVVPMFGENRTIAWHGLAALVATSLPGLRALIDSAGLSGVRIEGYDIGFKLAPRLNAAGRMGHAQLTVELFTSADQRRAEEIVLYLEDHNRARQTAERKITKQACEIVERDGLALDSRRAIVIAAEDWHPGVIGIVAARLTERYRRPTVLIAMNNGQGQGSARSIRHFDLANALASCGDHLLAHGGHAMAAGLRIAADRVESFTRAFVEVANNRLTADDLVARLRLDASIQLAELTLPTVESILTLGPFGLGNAKPRFAADWVELADEPRCVGQRSEHLQAVFRQNGVVVRAIGFGLADIIEDLKEHRRCRLAFEPIINTFNGRRNVELQLIDLEFPP